MNIENRSYTHSFVMDYAMEVCPGAVFKINNMQPAYSFSLSNQL